MLKTEDGALFTRDLVLNTQQLQQLMIELEKKPDPDGLTWQTCEDICKSYMDPDNRERRKDIGLKFLTELQNVKAAHSIGLRHKSVVSLLRKIVNKKSNPKNNPKYSKISSATYDKLLTDLIGVRILIRFKHQWKDVHDQLQNLFHNVEKHPIHPPMSRNETIGNTLGLLTGDMEYCYFYEEPVAYVHDKTENSTYCCDGGLAENQIHDSDHGYRSVHYIIRYFGYHIEVQVRTIFEEGWSECDHDLCYKEPDVTRKKVQKQMSDVLSGLAHQADEMSSLMFDFKKYEISQKKQEPLTKIEKGAE